MTEISILDLQNLRHLIGGYSTTHCKMTDYASKAEDPEIKKLFQEAADSAMKNKGNRTCQIYFKRKISQFRVQAIKNCRLNPDPTIEPTFHKIYFSIASAAPSWRFDDVT